VLSEELVQQISSITISLQDFSAGPGKSSDAGKKILPQEEILIKLI
jgi:hypothetical protein